MTVKFSVDRWAAWAPGLQDHAAWRAWLRAPAPIAHAETPALAEMAPLIRRRVDRLGRVALQAAYWARGEDSRACGTVVFASRQGDIACSLSLLRQLAQGEAMSPTAFSTSVHNAIGALYSIASSHTGPYTAVAAGAETVEAAFTEALGLLADGEPDVLVVYYDEPMPPPYEVFDGTIAFARATAYRLTRAKSGGFSLQSGPLTEACAAPDTATPLSPDLAVLDFLVSGLARQHVRTVGARRWQWSRHD